MTTTEQTTLHAASDKLMTAVAFGAQTFMTQTANRWNGTDLRDFDGETLRLTREDPEGAYWIGTLDWNGVVDHDAVVSGNVSAEALAAIAWTLWNDR